MGAGCGYHGGPKKETPMPIKPRLFLIAPALVLALSVLLPASGDGPGPAPAFAQQGLMQCMEQCIRHEGGNTAANKETCKSRCANVPMPAGRGAGVGGGRDCMAVHKECLAACGKDRTCKRACRKRLVTCK